MRENINKYIAILRQQLMESTHLSVHIKNSIHMHRGERVARHDQHYDGINNIDVAHSAASRDRRAPLVSNRRPSNAVVGLPLIRIKTQLHAFSRSQ